MYGSNMCRDLFSWPFEGSYFILVYKGTSVYIIWVCNFTRIYTYSKYLRNWETSEENVCMRSTFINFKHFYIQVFLCIQLHFDSCHFISSFHFNFSLYLFQNLLHSKSCQNFTLLSVHCVSISIIIWCS